MADWTKIKTEYITKGTSYRKLAKKYGVGESTLFTRASREQWVEQREQFQSKTEAKTLEAASNKEVDRVTRLHTVADKLLDKVEELIENGSPMTLNSQSMKHLSGVLKDIKDVHMIKSEDDMREQKARIASLEKATAENTGGQITVVLEGELAEYVG